jgi:hypothetical protein
VEVTYIFRTKLQHLQENYEGLVSPLGAVPRSLRYLNIEDKDGYQLHRAVVMAQNYEQYMNDCRKNGIVAKPFVYDFEKYKRDLHLKTELETKMNVLTVSPGCF